MILLDTHVMAWLAFDPARISNRAKAAIDQARRAAEGVAICDISLLELTALVSKGPIRLNVTLESFLREIESRFVVLPIGARECARSLQLPRRYPNDPADRIIGATSLVQGLPLVTADRAIRRSRAVHTVW